MLDVEGEEEVKFEWNIAEIVSPYGNLILSRSVDQEFAKIIDQCLFAEAEEDFEMLAVDTELTILLQNESGGDQRLEVYGDWLACYREDGQVTTHYSDRLKTLLLRIREIQVVDNKLIEDWLTNGNTKPSL